MAAFSSSSPFICLLPSPHPVPRPFNKQIVKTHVRMNLAVEFWLEKDQFGRRDLAMGNCRVEPSSVRTTVLTE